MFRERVWVRANFPDEWVERYEPFLVAAFQVERAAHDGKEPAAERVRARFERRYSDLLAEDRAAGAAV